MVPELIFFCLDLTQFDFKRSSVCTLEMEKIFSLRVSGKSWTKKRTQKYFTIIIQPGADAWLLQLCLLSIHFLSIHLKAYTFGCWGLSDSTWLTLLSPIWEPSGWNSHIPLGQCWSVTDLIMLVFTWGFICIPSSLSTLPQTKAELNVSVLEQLRVAC